MSKKQKEKKSKAFEKALSDTLYTTALDTLSDLLKTEYKQKDSDGKEVVDYEMTVRMIRTKARIAIDFVSNLKRQEVEK